MSAPRFTILLPVHRSPELLPFAIESVLAQEAEDFELIVICDGAPTATSDCAHNHAATDDRIKVAVHRKGERNGERWRDQALKSAKGQYICQIADDDLWFPNHLTELARLLDKCDFGNLTQTPVWPDGHFTPYVYDLANASVRERMLTDRFNFFGPTVAGYRLTAYRALSEGWSAAPPETWSDLFMWRKFLRHPGLRYATHHRITSLSFASPARTDWPLARRREENSRYAALLRDPGSHEDIRDAILADAAAIVGQRLAKLDVLENGGIMALALFFLGRLRRRISG